jgi:peptidoglycan hydrolase CwlO-like protein
MGKRVRSLGHVKTLMGMKHRSLPKAERANDAEIYLLKNNLSLSKKELGSISQRKKVIENRIEDIQNRIAELEAQELEKKAKMAEGGDTRKKKPKGNINVMKMDY